MVLQIYGRKNLQQKLGFVLLLLFLFPDTSLAQSDQPQSPVIYRCKKGKTFQVQFLPEIAQLTLPRNQVYPLRKTPSDSGSRYADKAIALYLKGEEAFIEINHKVIYDGCSSKTQKMTSETRYNCEAQVAPFLNKESMTLAQTEKLLLRRDGNLFIYHCYPQE